MPRFVHAAMVLGTLGLCIGINTWRYPIVGQMVAQLPTWEFSLQPKQVETAKSLSVPTHPPPVSNAHSVGAEGAGTGSPLSVRIGAAPVSASNSPSPALQSSKGFGEKPSSPIASEEAPSQSAQEILSLQAESSAASGEKPPPEGENPSSPHVPPPKQDNTIAQEKISISGGSPSALADTGQNNVPPHSEAQPNRIAPLPLVPLNTSEKPSKGAEQSASPLPSPSIGVCTGSVCLVGPKDEAAISGGKIPPGRARIVQVRPYPVEKEKVPSPLAGGAPPESLTNFPTPGGNHLQNTDSSSLEDKIELLPPVDPPVGGVSHRSRPPWPPGTIPFYPATQTN